MPEIERTSIKSNFITPLFPIFLDSLKIIFLENPNFFFTIFSLITFPLSILLTSLSISSTPRFLKSHIARLEWLSHVVPIWIEASNIQDEERADSRRLFRIRLLHGVPILALSLFAAVSIVVAAYAALRKKKKCSLRAVVGVVKGRWVPPLLTCMVNFILWVVWAHLDPVVDTYAVKYGYLTAVVQVVVEVYMMAVIGVGLVVSVIESRVGLDAIRVGSGLMQGRRVCGWVLSGLILLVSGFIGRQMVGVMNGQDLGVGSGGYTWTVEMRVGKRHVIKEDEQLVIDEIDI
ncbi:Protein RecA [Bienertia sinuspersici]